MEQHTYSFPKVTPCDPRELREGLQAYRRRDAERRAADVASRRGIAPIERRD